MYDDSSNRRGTSMLTRGDTPVDMIRYSDKGHVPANTKKIRSVVGRSNRHEADPSTAGRAGYKGYTPSPTPTVFNRAAHNSSVVHNAANTSMSANSNNTSLLLSSMAGYNANNFNQSGGGAGGLAYRPLSTTPNPYFHSATRHMTSVGNINSAAIPSLRDEDRNVDALDTMMRESAIAVQNPSALIHLGGTRFNQNTSLHHGGNGAVGLADIAGGPDGMPAGDGTALTTVYAHNQRRAHTAMGGTTTSSLNGSRMPDPRHVLRSIREERARNTTVASLAAIGHSADAPLHPPPAYGAAGIVPMATVEDSRTRLFRARAGSALATIGGGGDAAVSSLNTTTSAANATVSGAERPSVLGHSQRIGHNGGAMTSSFNRSANSASAGPTSRSVPDPRFFSQKHDGLTHVVVHRSGRTISRATSSCAATRPSVFDDVDYNNATQLRPKLRFELTDYHNSFGTFQAPAYSGMNPTSEAMRFSATDRGLGSTLLGQEDKLKRAARSAAHSEAIAGVAQRVQENVDAEGARMRMLRENRSVTRAMYH